MFWKNNNVMLKCAILFSAPFSVPTPKVTRVGGGRIGLQLAPASEINGPLSYYELVVVPEENATKGPQDFTIDEVSTSFAVTKACIYRNIADNRRSLS